MLMLPNKKKIATIIVGSMKDKEHSDFVDRGDGPQAKELENPSEDDSYGLEQMGADLCSAVAAKDGKRVASILKDFVSMCGPSDDMGE